MDKQKYMELARYKSMPEAQINKSLLDSFGIPNELMNDMIYGTVPSAKSGVRIIVNESDYERAKEIMNAEFDKNGLK